MPARRLRLDGRSPRAILGYVALLLALALGVTELRPLARYLLPLLGVVYLAPFVTWRGGLARLFGRRGPDVRVTLAEPPVIPPPRDVTPPTGDTGPPDEHPADGRPDDGHPDDGHPERSGPDQGRSATAE